MDQSLYPYTLKERVQSEFQSGICLLCGKEAPAGLHFVRIGICYIRKRNKQIDSY
jgi:hypothetical protein